MTDKEVTAALTKETIARVASNKAIEGALTSSDKKNIGKQISMTSMKNQRKELTKLTKGALTTKEAFEGLGSTIVKGLGSALKSVPGQIGIAITVFDLLSSAYSKLKKELGVEKAKNDFEKANSDWKTAKERLDSINERIYELNNQDRLTLTDEKELATLKEENEELEKQVKELKKVNDEEEKRYKKRSKRVTDKYLGEYQDRYVSKGGTSAGLPSSTASLGGTSPYGTTSDSLRRDTEDRVKIDTIEKEIELYQYLNSIQDKSKQQEDALKASKEALTKQAEKYLKYSKDENLTTEDKTRLYQKYLDTLKALDPIQYKITVLQDTLGEGSKEVKQFNSAIKEMTKDGELSQEEISELMGNEGFRGLIDTLAESGIGLQDVIDLFGKLGSEVQNNAMSFDDYISQIKSLEDTYSGLNSVVDEFNNYGALSAETVQKILDNDWAQYLNLANGQLSINTALLDESIEKSKEKALALIDEQEQTQLTALAKSILSEQEATGIDNTSAIVSSERAKGQATQITGNLYMQTAAKASIKNKAEKGEIETTDGKLWCPVNSKGGNIDISTFDFSSRQDEYNKIVTNAAARRNLVNLMGSQRSRSTSSGGGSGRGGSSGGSSSSSKEWWEEQLDKLKEQFQYNEITIEEYINGLNGLLNGVERGTDARRQINEELQKQRLSKVEDDYKRGVISIDEYISKLKELAQAYRAGTDAWNELADKIKSALSDKLQKQQKGYEDAADAAVGIIDDEIEKLEKLKDEQEEYYDKLIEDKKTANEETEKELELARLKEALENSKKEKTKRVFREGLGWQWEADKEAIDEAQKALDDFLNEQEINELEKKKEEAIKNIQDQIDAWDKYKESWESVADDYETQQARITLAQQLGADAEAKILQQRLDVLEQYKNGYLATMKEIENLEKKSLSDIVGTAPQTSGTSGGGASSGGRTYTVQRGDTLSGIGSRYGVSWNSIYEANKGIIGGNPNLIRPGQTLTIPGYAEGGIVDYTGLAMLHGTKNEPEFVLNNTQMKNIISNIVDPRMARRGNGENKVTNYNFGNIELPNVQNARQFLSELKSLVNITKHQ